MSRGSSGIPLPKHDNPDTYGDPMLYGMQGEPVFAGERPYPEPLAIFPDPAPRACPWHRRLVALCKLYSWEPNVPLLAMSLRTTQPFHGPPAKAYCQQWEKLLGLPVSEF